MFGYRIEHVLVDHVAAGIVQPGTLLGLFNKCHQRQFHVNTRNMPEHLLEFDLLGMHEQGIRDLSRADLLALPAVHARIGDMGKTYHVEHEIDGKIPWRDVCWIFRRAFDTVTDRAGIDAPVALDAP